MKKHVILALALLAAVASPVFAQSPIRIGAKVGVPGPVAVPGGYDDGARRDPFISLIAPKRVANTLVRPVGGGLKAMAVADAKVTGIQNLGTRIALIEGPDGKTYRVREKDKLFDGYVKSIEAGVVVFVEQNIDALGVAHPQEVRKAIRAAGGGGQ